MQKLNFLGGKKPFSQNGSVLVGVIAMAMIMAVACLGYLQLSTSTANNEIAMLRESDALRTAESGMLLGFKWLRDTTNAAAVAAINFPNTDNPAFSDIIPDWSLNNFDVQVDIFLLTAASAATGTYRATPAVALIQSTASSSGATGYNKAIRKSVTIGKLPYDSTALNSAIVCNGAFNFGGCGTISVPAGFSGNLHSNNAITISGSAGSNINITSSVSIGLGNKNVSVNGSLTAPSVDLKGGSATSVTIQDVPEIPIPDIDLTPWYEIALANNQVMNSPPNSNNYTPPGGVLWLRGNVTMTKSVNGTVIVEGDATVNANITSPDSGFALASVNGDIKIGSAVVTGLIYAKSGNFDQASNGTVKGQIIVNGTIGKNGNSDISVYKKVIPVPPGGSYDNYAAFLTGSWNEQNIVP